MSDKTNYAQWRSNIQQMEEAEAQMAAIAPLVDVWRAVDPVVPLLFDALREEYGKLKGHAKVLANALAAADSNPAKGKELGTKAVEYTRMAERVRKLKDAFDREKAHAERANAALVTGFDVAPAATAPKNGARKRARPLAAGKTGAKRRR